MNRRTVIKQIAISSAAAFLFPSCFKDNRDQNTYVKLNNVQVTEDEKDLVGMIADVIVPETDSPGALKLEAHTFALVMVDDCLSKKDQEQYLSGLRSFDNSVESLTGQSFRKTPAAERAKILEQVQRDKDKLAKEVNYFYNRTRGYVVQAYTTSQHFLTTVKEYQLIPGPSFHGCAPAQNQPLANG
ncbi:MAG TPA: gluconate 2-dehydrogenase subunit 3 family protein [Chryseosolibacter sp.]|nr:gluconate 2-dehydrogenase subunit 3 family protein [Chryseosolibacter sp.]